MFVDDPMAVADNQKEIVDWIDKCFICLRLN